LGCVFANPVRLAIIAFWQRNRQNLRMNIFASLQAMIQESEIADQQLDITDAIVRVEKLNEGLRAFWSSAHGWAPTDAADLMSKSRLDRQVSLSRSLRHWAADPPDSLEEGDLILGWANLGSLIEGTIKLFLAVYYQDYKADVETLKQTQAWHTKQEKLLDPDGLPLGVLIDYVEKAGLFPADEIALFKQVQSYRNAIHAFKDRPLGSGNELHAAIKEYLGMLRSTATRFEYPDHTYEPQEH
jgi:hypothetical protein